MSVFRVRLVLDFLAVALIIACLAYWWLDNLAHELVGAGLLALVIVHNVFNRRWYGGLTKRRMDAVRIVNLVTIAGLAVIMMVMLVTSFLVSRDLFPFTALSGAFAVREIHMFAGYWALLIISVHLGTRWGVVMNAVRTTFGMQQPNRMRAWICRLLVLGIVAWGVKSFPAMDLGSKLMLTYSLDMWDFSESTGAFFLNYAAIVGMFAAFTHYALAAILFLHRPAPNPRKD
jgi:hypothetical protein